MIPCERLTRQGKAPRSYAYCSDTAYRPALVPLLREVSLLYHEATFLKDRIERAKVTAHSTAEQAARIAADAGVQRLIIGHYSARYTDIQPLLDEAQSVFPETVAADEGMILEL